MDSSASSSKAPESRDPPKKLSKFGSTISASSIIAEVLGAVPYRPLRKRGRDPRMVFAKDYVNSKRKREREQNVYRLGKLVGFEANHGRMISKAADKIEANNSKLHVINELNAKELEKKRLMLELNNLKNEYMASEAQLEEAKKTKEVLMAGTHFYKEKYVRICKEMSVQPDIYDN